ncbi:MAG: hypothetical protein EXS46_02715 [Candidatus Taylorbacteria bacterium]|nr:hypothetical protein [Candidatus Taylorbacteria bacterium]
MEVIDFEVSLRVLFAENQLDAAKSYFQTALLTELKRVGGDFLNPEVQSCAAIGFKVLGEKHADEVILACSKQVSDMRWA